MIYSFISAFNYICTVSLVSKLNNDHDFPTDQGILILNQANFNKAIKRYKFILVNFYLSTCSYCKRFESEYAKVERLLAERESGIKVAKVDATVEVALAKQHNAASYPTLILFKDGTPVYYNGILKSNYIVAWLTRETSSQ
jgi:protein disulfide-isomerase A1